MRLLLTLLLIPFFCLAQQEDIMLKINQIDSIIKTSDSTIKASGTIKKKRALFGEKVIGGFSEIVYFENSLPKSNIDKSNLIKAIYGENITIKKGYVENIFAEFYYNNNTLFFVRIKKIEDKKDTKSVSLIYEIDFEKDIDPKINEELGFNAKKWIENMDSKFKEYLNSNTGI